MENRFFLRTKNQTLNHSNNNKKEQKLEIDVLWRASSLCVDKLIVTSVAWN